MLRRWWVCCVALVPTFAYLGGGRAWAADSPPRTADRWSDTRVYAQGRLGLGSPVGLAGATAELSPGRYGAVWAGVGHNAFGVQLAAMGHLRLPVGEAVALTAGAGLSRGAYEHRTNWIDADHSDDAHWNAAVFGYGELGLEIRGPNRFQVRVGFGLGRAPQSGRRLLVYRRRRPQSLHRRRSARAPGPASHPGIRLRRNVPQSLNISR